MNIGNIFGNQYSKADYPHAVQNWLSRVEVDGFAAAYKEYKVAKMIGRMVGI